jgi:hypothetical protein
METKKQTESTASFASGVKRLFLLAVSGPG